MKLIREHVLLYNLITDTIEKHEILDSMWNSDHPRSKCIYCKDKVHGNFYRIDTLKEYKNIRTIVKFRILK